MKIIKGVYTNFCVNVAEGAMTGTQKIIMTFKKRYGGRVLFTREITTEGTSYFQITPEEASLVRNHAVYDFDKILEDGRRFQMHCVGRIFVQQGVGRCDDNDTK